jgi:uncharacterized protein (TIGR03437 family)
MSFRELSRLAYMAILTASSASAQSFSFQPAATYAAQRGPLATASGDFNGDGKLDLAVANAGSSSISIFLGKGDGTFSSAPTVAVPGGCIANNLTVADFNRDGKADLLVACAVQNMVWVIPGAGAGQFGTAIATTLPGYSVTGQLAFFNFHNVTVADFNGDGNPDLVLLLTQDLSSSTTGLVLMLGKGDGTFQSASTVLASIIGGAVVTADFNGDGKPDMAIDYISSGTAGGVTILLGKGDGTFLTGNSYSTPGPPLLGSLLAADWNGDGKPDLVAASSVTTGVTTAATYLTAFTGNGDGTFKQTFNVATTGPTLFGMAAGNFRGTGNVDLLEEKLPPPPYANGLLASAMYMTIRPGNGDGTFQSPIPLNMPAGLYPLWLYMATGDWNGDGLPDLAFAASPASATLPDGGETYADFASQYQSMPAGDLVVMLNSATLSASAIGLTSRQMQFTAIAGGANPAAQSVTISNSGAGTLAWTAASSASWLTVSPKSGSGTTTLTVAVSPAGLTPGTYTGAISLTAAGAVNSPQTISATLTVSAASNLPTITGVINGASFQPGFESGSWVTIQGTNLSNTSPGRTWTAAEIVNGHLPTALDTTSVTIDGRPAYVYYISPTQLNVQAPDDSASGPVLVVVNNNGQMSAAFTAQLQTYSPAFFLYGATGYAIASHYPDYGLVGNPSVNAGTVAAKPGDILILWATGFGPTSPTTPAGVEVTGAPGVATPPQISVGGLPVPTVATPVLAPGSAGLYQIAVQLPANVPTGPVPLQASVGGAISPSGVLLYVTAQ